MIYQIKNYILLKALLIEPLCNFVCGAGLRGPETLGTARTPPSPTQRPGTSTVFNGAPRPGVTRRMLNSIKKPLNTSSTFIRPFGWVHF